MIRVSGKTPVPDDVAKARKIVAAGQVAIFTGDPRHLRRMRDALVADDATDLFLGDDDAGHVVLYVGPRGGVAGALVADRVPPTD